MTITDATDSRFAFGENWLSFLEHLSEERIIEAEKSVQALTGFQRLDGKRFIDIGSGSGLFSLAAKRLGAFVYSFDYDEQSVAATKSLKERFFPKDTRWFIEQGSILNTSYLIGLGKFDIVFSWGVLHHTGAMYDAIRNAASLTNERGLFVFALYRKTKLCGLWFSEKRWYSSTSVSAQKIARDIYIGIFRLGLIAKGRNFEDHVKNYKKTRGMDFDHDVHDWMGGYPYESIGVTQVTDLMSSLGFKHVRSNVRSGGLGLLGSGCDEYVFIHKII